jgi:hypothetical protein
MMKIDIERQELSKQTTKKQINQTNQSASIGARLLNAANKSIVNDSTLRIDCRSTSDLHELQSPQLKIQIRHHAAIHIVDLQATC